MFIYNWCMSSNYNGSSARNTYKELLFIPIYHFWVCLISPGCLVVLWLGRAEIVGNRVVGFLYPAHHWKTAWKSDPALGVISIE